MGSSAPFAVRVEARNGVSRIALSGELDIATAPQLTDQLAAAEQDGVQAVMVDLRDLTFIDSSGLHAFLQASTRAKGNGHRFLIVGANDVAKRVFEMTETEFLLDEREAVSVLNQFTGNGTSRTSQTATDPVLRG